jgi:hypothetical protein
VTVRGILKEPRGETYTQLLQFCAEHSAQFSLVWRDQLDHDPEAGHVLQCLLRFQVRVKRTSKWPVTELIGHSATVRFFRCELKSVAVLRANASGLYEWLAPRLPEDLAFYDSRGAWWLAAVSHERQAFIRPECVNVDRLVGAVPGVCLGKDERWRDEWAGEQSV